MFNRMLEVAELKNLQRAHKYAQPGPIASMYFAHFCEKTAHVTGDPAGALLIDYNGPAPGLCADNITPENVLTLLSIPSELAARGLACVHITDDGFVLRKKRWQLCNAESLYVMGAMPPAVGPAAPAACMTNGALEYLATNHEAQMLTTMHCILVTIAKAVDPFFDGTYVGCKEAGLMLPTQFAYQVYDAMWQAFACAWPKHEEALFNIKLRA